MEAATSMVRVPARNLSVTSERFLFLNLWNLRIRFVFRTRIPLGISGFAGMIQIDYYFSPCVPLFNMPDSITRFTQVIEPVDNRF